MIRHVVPLEQLPADVATVDLHGKNLAPGFIDLQVNGGGDVLFSDEPSASAIETILAAHRRHGTTSILPTLITSSRRAIGEAIEAVRPFRMKRSSTVLGLHLEGPFLNPRKAGIHDAGLMREPMAEDLQLIRDAGFDIVRLVTVAPECTPSHFVSQLASAGIRVFLGHTDATYQQAREAMENGACGVTHLFNAMSPFEGRKPGVVGASLDLEETWASVIPDGFHVAFESIRIARRVKGERLFLVTDAMPPAGGSGQGFQLGGRQIHLSNGRCATEEGTLAGSSLDMATAVRNLVGEAGIPLAEALRMASLYPARLLGMASQFGMIASGYQANLVIFDNQVVVENTIVDGEPASA